MANQPSLKSLGSPPDNGHSQSASAGVRHGIDDLLHDIVSLGELQTQLLAADLRESTKKVWAPVILLALGAGLGLGAVPILLLALAEGLHQFGGLAQWLSYLISGAVGITLAAVLVALACKQSNKVLVVFKRSQTELSENVRWIKYALTRGRRPPR